ncbi:inactive C-alpha-formylglycine-generating enzyme 2-like [Mytilus galloprovincialis]|uniref:inactive C-alpha-formylglycine-generating enzyme 2-like n=1 Tax=Mytilus galloprovincialis TaxID=29158 RepID=UPI003F7B598C
MANICFNLVFILLLYVLEILSLDLKNVIDHYERYNLMKVLEGGKFLKGINDPKSETGEYPVEVAEVKPFYIDVYPVTNAQFWKFKQLRSGYKTDAETQNWSYVLRPFVNGTDIAQFKDAPWVEVKGAQWDKPEGPNSTVVDRLDYPVVHVSYHDAKAFCEHYKKRIPLEVEWEFAARGGYYAKDYPWGDRYQKNRANLWQGKFPNGNTKADKWEGLSPVHAFSAQNDFGLYDMQGNVWEWTDTRYYERVVPRHVQDRMYVVKGCSFVDTRDGRANSIVRVAQRMGLVPSYTAQNVGFRCAKSAKHYWKPPVAPPKKVLPMDRPSGPRHHLRSEMADPDLAEKLKQQRLKRKEEL